MELKEVLTAPLKEIQQNVDLEEFKERLKNQIERKYLSESEKEIARNAFDEALKNAGLQMNSWEYIEDGHIPMWDNYSSENIKKEKRAGFDGLEVWGEGDFERFMCDGKKVRNITYWALLLDRRLGYSKLMHLLRISEGDFSKFDEVEKILDSLEYLKPEQIECLERS